MSPKPGRFLVAASKDNTLVAIAGLLSHIRGTNHRTAALPSVDDMTSAEVGCNQLQLIRYQFNYISCYIVHKFQNAGQFAVCAAAPCSLAVCLLTLLAMIGTVQGAFTWGVAT